MIYKNYYIDETKLKRDYIKNPLKRIFNNVNYHYEYELPIREDLEYLYLSCKIPKKYIAKFFNVGESTVCKFFKIIDIKKNTVGLNDKLTQLNINVNNLSRNYELSPLKRGEYMCYNDFYYLYIDKNLSRVQLSELFNISLVKVSRHQKLYNIIKDANKYCINTVNTTLKKYGVKHYSELPISNEKMRQTNLQKYGKEWNTQRHLSSRTLNILANKELLKNFIIENNIQNGIQLAEKLKCSIATTEHKIKNFKLNYLFDYSKSLPEKEIRDFIQQFFIIKSNTKKELNGKEIDIYIPSKNIGIEFNGNYWHGEHCKDAYYHQNKSLKAKENGIFLYHIFEYEWKMNKDKIFSQIKDILDIDRKIITSDNTEVKVNDNKLGNISVGLYKNDELLMSMVFQRLKKNNYKLIKFGIDNNIKVNNGYKIMLEYFIRMYNPNKIIAYSDFSKNNDIFYENLQMKEVMLTQPNYIWFKNGKIKKSRNITLMKSKGYYRIYDSGRKKWVWEK